LINGILVGVASFRNGPVCESVDGRYPNVYTDVAQYVRLSHKPPLVLKISNPITFADKLD
jgi:hypothetical protein